MRIYFANTLLCSADLAGGRVGPVGLTINGQQVNDAAGFFRADAETYYPRTRSTEVAFRVGRMYSTYEAAQLGASLHFAQLPKQGDLQFFNAAGTGISKLPSAVVGGVRAVEIRGVGFGLEYQFLGGVLTTEDIEIPDESDLVKTGTVTLDADDESKVIVFDVPFGAAPNFVGVQLCPPTGEPGFDSWPIKDTITAEGFTAKLGAVVPGSGYELRWAAIL